MKALSKKGTLFAESRIREMTILAEKYGAINLAQGFPEFDPPQSLKDTLKAVSENGPFQYASNWGLQKLREAIAAKQSKAFGREIDPETEVLVTCGSTEAMISVMMALLDPGDKVIIFSPYYTSYLTNSLILGAEPVFVPLEAPEFTFDPEKLENAFRQGAKALVLCNPSNPCGRVFAFQELELIAAMAMKYDAYVLVDEVYEHIVFEPYRHVSFASLPGMYERTITCSSLSKTYSVTGWRLGYVTAKYEILEEIRKFHDCLTVCAPSTLQAAAVTALSYSDEYYKELQRVYTRKRDLFLNGLDEIGLVHSIPQGTYFTLVDISGFGVKSDVEFSYFLTREYGVATVPCSCFFADHNNNYIRFHFAKNDETLQEVVGRLARLQKDAKGGRLAPMEK